MVASPSALADRETDLIAAQLPRITWRLLPVLLTVGVLGAVVAFGLLWVAGAGFVTVALYGVLIIGPTVAVVVNAVERGLHDGPPHVPYLPAGWQIRRAIAVVAWPSMLAAVACGTVEAWDFAGGAWFLASAALAVIALCISMIGSIVAAPLAATRADAALSSIWKVSLYAVTKAPLAPIGALAFAGITVYLAVQYTVAAVVLVLPLAVVVGDLAARTCAARAGVSFVPTVPAAASGSTHTAHRAQRRVSS